MKTRRTSPADVELAPSSTANDGHTPQRKPKRTAAKITPIDSARNDTAIQANLDAIAKAKDAIAMAKTNLRKLGYKAEKRPYVELTPAACDVSGIEKMHTFCNASTHLGQLPEGRACFQIYDAMRRISHETGEFYLSIEQIAKATGLRSHSHIRAVLKRLDETKWAKQTKQGYGHKNGRVNRANTWQALDHDNEWAAKHSGFCATKVPSDNELEKLEAEVTETKQDSSYATPQRRISTGTQADIHLSSGTYPPVHRQISTAAQATNPDPNPDLKPEKKREKRERQKRTLSLSSSSVDEAKAEDKEHDPDNLFRSLYNVGDHAQPKADTSFTGKYWDTVKALLPDHTVSEISSGFQYEFDKCGTDNYQRGSVVRKFCENDARVAKLAIEAAQQADSIKNDPMVEKFLGWVETKFNGTLSIETTRDVPGIASALRKHGMDYCQEALQDACATEQDLRKAIPNFLKIVDAKVVGYKDRDTRNAPSPMQQEIDAILESRGWSSFLLDDPRQPENCPAGFSYKHYIEMLMPDPTADDPDRSAWIVRPEATNALQEAVRIAADRPLDVTFESWMVTQFPTLDDPYDLVAKYRGMEWSDKMRQWYNNRSEAEAAESKKQRDSA